MKYDFIQQTPIYFFPGYEICHSFLIESFLYREHEIC